MHKQAMRYLRVVCAMTIGLFWCVAGVSAAPRLQNAKDFGAKGDGKTDDTTAIQRFVTTVEQQGLGYAAGIYERSYPEIVFPEGTYLVSKPIFFSVNPGVRGLNIRGEGKAVIRQINPDRDVFYLNRTYRILVENLTFEGGKHHLKIYNENWDAARVVIKDCTFRNSSSFAIEDILHGPKGTPANDFGYLTDFFSYYYGAIAPPYKVDMIAGLPELTPQDESGPIVYFNSTQTHITRCKFEKCMKVLNGQSDGSCMDNCVIETNPDMKGAAIFSGGILMLENITGLAHVTEGNNQRWIDKWHYGLIMRNVKLNTDSNKGLCAVYNTAGFMPGGLVHTYIIADGCEFKSAGSEENCLIYLQEAPNLINIRNCRETSGKDVNIIGCEKEFNPEYFKSISKEGFAFILDDNNRRLIPNLPGAMKPFAEKPLPKKVAALFKKQVMPVDDISMRAFIKERLNVADFGALGDNKADDTAAIQRALDAAAAKKGVELLFPNGIYKISRELALPEEVALRGLGQAVFMGDGSLKTVFAAKNVRHLSIANFAFAQCQTAVSVATKASSESRILLDSCLYSWLIGPAIICESGIDEKNRTYIRVSNSSFLHMGQALVSNAHYAVFDNNWVMPSNEAKNPAVLVNKGTLRVENLLGVPQAKKGTDPRWVDNYYRITLDNCRFGGEGGGDLCGSICLVVNRGNKGYALVENSWAYADGNEKRPAMIYCEALPEVIALRSDVGGMGDQKMVMVEEQVKENLKGRFFESGNTVPAICSSGPTVVEKLARAGPVAVRADARGLTVDLGQGVSFEMLRVEPGEFAIGSPLAEKGRDGDENVHRVRITKPFYLGSCEVTQEVWRRVFQSDIPTYKSRWPGILSYPAANPSKFSGKGYPVNNVCWIDCREFLDRLNALVPGGGFRLPTEAEWEYACRAGTKTAFSFGDDPAALGNYAWYKGNSKGKPHVVGTKLPNPWGFFDMDGNVWEWCQDKYDGPYSFGPADVIDNYALQPADLGDLKQAIRGGSCFFDAPYCRSANRCGSDPWHRDDDNGLRLVRTIP